MSLDRRQLLRLMAATGAAAACGVGRRPAVPRLVLLWSGCSVNCSYLAPYNAAVDFTPNLARLAREGVVLERQWTEAGQSGIAFASLVTGTQADRHGVFQHPAAIAAGVPTLTGAFAAAGWEAWHFDGHALAAADLGYAPGVGPGRHVVGGLTADQPLFGQLLAGLAADPGRRAVVLSAFTATHMPYTANPRFFADADRSPDTLPAEFARLGLERDEFLRHRERFLTTPVFELATRFAATTAGWGMDEAERRRFAAAGEYLYCCAVHRWDALLGGVLERLDAAGLAPETVVAVTADHGETLVRPGSHFAFSHGYQLAPEVLTVPLLIRAPGVAPGRVVAVTRSIDVLPTLAGLAGLGPLAPAPDGLDLAPLLRGDARPPVLAAYAHTSLVQPAILASPAFAGSALEAMFPRHDPALMWVARRAGDRVLTWRAVDPAAGEFGPAAFELGRDPFELADTFDAAADGAALAELLAYKRRLVARAGEVLGQPPALTDADRDARLRALGYLE